MKKLQGLFSLLLALAMTVALRTSALAAYPDVSDDDWYAQAANELYEKGIMNGMDGGFNAGGTFTRAQLATVLYRMAGSPAVTGEDSFTDTTNGAWYASAVTWAERNKVVNGIGNSQFGPERATTQEQLVTMLYRNAGQPKVEGTEIPGASDWAADALKWANAQGMLEKVPVAFLPQSPATRALVAVLTAAYLKEKDAQPTPASGKTLIAYFTWSDNTKGVAEHIADKTGGTLYRIEPKTPYPTEYTPTTEVAKVEADENARPAILSPLASISEYDSVILCYPIWWHTAPMIIGTFLESYDFSGKTIYPYSQSASMNESQYQESLAFLRDNTKSATVDEGLFARSSELDRVDEYLAAKGLVKTASE